LSPQNDRQAISAGVNNAQQPEKKTGKVDILVGAFMLVKGIYIKN
jgi:hypothetical protein